MVTEKVGTKFDKGKPRPTLVPSEVINELVRVHHERRDEVINDALAELLTSVAGDLADGDYADALYDVTSYLAHEDGGCVGALAGLLPVVEVLEYGAELHGEENWKLVPNATRRYLDAAYRHLLSVSGGQDLDADTGKRHLAHLGCCLVFLAWFKAAAK